MLSFTATDHAWRPALFGLAALAAALICAPPVAAQEAAVEEAAPVVAIPAEDVPEAAVQANVLVESVAPTPEQAAEIERLGLELERLLAGLEARMEVVGLGLEGTPKARAMQEWVTDLRSIVEPLRARDATLDQRLAGIRQATDQLEAERARWVATGETLAADESAVRERVAATMAQIDGTLSALRDQRSELLAMRDLMVDPLGDAERTVGRLAGLIEGRLGGIFRRDQSAIWQAELGRSIRNELAEGGSAALAGRFDRFVEYSGERLQKIGLVVLLVILLAFGLRAAGRHARSLAVEDYDLTDAIVVFERPVSMALVIVLGQAGLFFPNSPFLFQLAAFSLVVVPAALIVGSLLSAANRPVVWALLAVFLVDRVRDFLDAVPSLQRGLFIVELLAVVAFLLWLRRAGRTQSLSEAVQRETLFRVVRRLTGVAIGLLVFALLAELSGLGDLAELVGGGTLNSAYAALFIYALLKVLQSLVAYALLLPPLRLLRLVSSRRKAVRRWVDGVLRLAAALTWGYLTLDYFGLAGAFNQAVLAIVNAELAVGTLTLSLGSVLVLVLTIWLTFLLARFLDTVLNEDVFPRVSLERGVPYAISTLTRYSLIVIGFMIALAAAGIELSKLTFIAGGLSVGIGFGLQQVVSNFVSGLILLFERPLKVGDDITVKTVTGEIRRIGIRASSIRTDDGAEVILPNAQLIQEAVTNWTFRGRRRRVEMPVTAKGGVAAQDVIDLLVATAKAERSVLDSPSPKAFLSKYGEGSLEFTLRVWIAEFRDEAATRSELAVAVQRALAEAGVAEPLRRVAADPGAQSD